MISYITDVRVTLHHATQMTYVMSFQWHTQRHAGVIYRCCTHFSVSNRFVDVRVYYLYGWHNIMWFKIYRYHYPCCIEQTISSGLRFKINPSKAGDFDDFSWIVFFAVGNLNRLNLSLSKKTCHHDSLAVLKYSLASFSKFISLITTH